MSAFMLQLELNSAKVTPKCRRKGSPTVSACSKNDALQTALAVPGRTDKEQEPLEVMHQLHEPSAVPGVKLFSRLIKGKGKAASGLQHLAFSTHFNAVQSTAKAELPQPQEDSSGWNTAGTPYDGRLLITKPPSCLSKQLHSIQCSSWRSQGKTCRDKTRNPSPDANFSTTGSWIQLQPTKKKKKKRCALKFSICPTLTFGLEPFTQTRIWCRISVPVDHRHPNSSVWECLDTKTHSHQHKAQTWEKKKTTKTQAFEFKLVFATRVRKELSLSTYIQHLIISWYC